MYEVMRDVEVLMQPKEQTRFKPRDVEEACLREFKNANSYDIALFEKFVEVDEHMMSLSQNKNLVDTEIITLNT